MALFRRIQEYVALDANNITFFFDSGNIVNISGNIFLYPPQGAASGNKPGLGVMDTAKITILFYCTDTIYLCPLAFI